MDRVDRSADKFAERREQLAGAALETLADLGYARTSLREIAQNSEFSHGVLHYYFTDKVDLITESVRQYKKTCVKRYDHVIDAAETSHELRIGFGAAMAQTLREDARYHRLWYDLRSQSMFDPTFRPDVIAIDTALSDMIWRVVLRYVELAGTEITVPRDVAYAAFDGVFQHRLHSFLDGDGDAPAELAGDVERMIDVLIPTGAPLAVTPSPSGWVG